jgi:hypothetical protein
LLASLQLPSVFGTETRSGIGCRHAASSIAGRMGTTRQIVERLGVSGFGIHSVPRLGRGRPPPPSFCKSGF